MNCAAVVGHTGATGHFVVLELLKLGVKVKVFGRKPFAEEKVDSIIVDNLLEIGTKTTPEQWDGVDVIFNCLGTTRAIAGSGEKFVEIERDMSLAVMKAAKKQDSVKLVSVISAGSANINSPGPLWFHPLLYAKTLGEKEEAAKSQGFKMVSIFRPGMLDRENQGSTHGSLVSFISMLPIDRLRVSILAKAMVLNAQARLQAQDNLGVQTYTGNPNIRKVAGL